MKETLKEKEMICIVCPIGCHINVIESNESEDGYEVEGNKCPRGKIYGIKEMTSPTRVVSTTVSIENAFLKRLPVKTDNPVPKDLIFECMKIINEVVVKAPVKVGDIIIENILDTGVNIVATRSMNEIK
jgi:CxxC motif-containing protein